MTDLILGAALILVLSAAATWCGAAVARRARHAIAVLVVAGTILLLGVYFLCVHGSLALARLLPFSNVIMLGNWLPIGVGLLAGIVLGSRATRRWRRVALFAVLAGLSLFSLFLPLMRIPPTSGAESWTEKRVCLQSSPASCSPCAAATLLDHHGIPSSEAELMGLCLTDRTGTPTLGLYRGLKRKTRGSPLAVSVVHGDVAALLEEDAWPVLLLCELPDEDHPDFRRVRHWGWTPGAGHAVVVFGRVGPSGFEVGDPMVGRELWTFRDMRTVFSGRGLRLVPR